MHPVYFQKTSAAPFGNRSPQLRGAWVCTWADLQNLQWGAAPTLQTETRWTEREEFLFLSDPLVKAPHFCRLLCWMGVARYSLNYSGCMVYSQTLTLHWVPFSHLTTLNTGLCTALCITRTFMGEKNLIVELYPDNGPVQCSVMNKWCRVRPSGSSLGCQQFGPINTAVLMSVTPFSSTAVLIGPHSWHPSPIQCWHHDVL